MLLTAKTFLIVCPLVFLAGFVDAIGGGGGLIALPAYMLAGIPTHMAVATNKLSSCCGTGIATITFLRKGLVNMKLGILTILCAILGSSIGANLSLHTDEKVLKVILIPVLIVSAFFVLNKHLFGKEGSDEVVLDRRTLITACIAALVVGFYDGFYGPGTGTFLIIAMNVFAHISVKKSNAQAKVINLTTNITSLVVFVLGGQVVWKLGLAAALCNMTGSYLGTNLAIEKGSRITRPVILLVLALLFLKILTGN